MIELQSSKMKEVSLDHPPKTLLFRAFWGRHVQLLDGDNSDKPESASARRVQGNSSNSTDVAAAASAAATSAVMTIVRDLQTNVDPDRLLLRFMLDHEGLFPKTIDFLKTLTDCESADPNGRDWVQYADRVVGLGFLHAGHLLLWKEEEILSTFSSMPIGMVRYLLCKVQRVCEQLMDEHKSDPVPQVQVAENPNPVDVPIPFDD